jgi:acetyltransferase-like isoleucine patch superfamily enzyme
VAGDNKSHAAVTGGGSSLQKYQDVIVGHRSIPGMLYFELCMFLGAFPGALGLILRKLFWPRMFGSCGKGVQFGQNIVVRHPKRIHLGNKVVISEFCILDARTEHSEQALTLGDDVIMSNYVMISCKDGTVTIGARTGIGAQTIIQSTNQCPVTIGDDVMIGPRCYLVGGGNYNTDRLDVPMREQGIKPDTGVRIASDVWLGANVSVIGGVEIGAGSISATGAVVNRTVPERAICAGVPARVVKMRGE